VSALLHSLEVESKWELFASTHLIVLCHSKNCDNCLSYVGHLATTKQAGELDPQPSNIEEAMEKAWPGSIAGIREDAKRVLRRNYEDTCCELDDMRRDLDNACQCVDELEGHLDHAQGEATRSARDYYREQDR